MKHGFRTLALLALAAFSAFGADYYPPGSRFQDVFVAGVNVGVVGGIPSRSNIVHVEMQSGATPAQNSAAFAAALAGSTDDDIILIPAGTFSCNVLSVPYWARNRTIRGAGQGVTVLRPVGTSTAILIGSETNYQFWEDNGRATITAMVRGSNTIAVDDGSRLPSPVGEASHRIALIELVNEAATPVAHVSGYERVRTFPVLVTARSGNTLTLSQPILSDFPPAALAGARITFADQRDTTISRTGVEDLTIDGAGGQVTTGVRVMMAANCWVKNVHVVNVSNYGMFQTDAVNCEIRGSRIDGPGGSASNHAGILYQTSSYGLVEDNASAKNFPEIEINFGVTWCVFAYNYLGGGGFGGVLDDNHGPHNSYNIFEGNSFEYNWADGFFGSVSEHTYLRNHFRQGGNFGVLKRFTRNFTYVGNIIGKAGDAGTDGSERWGQPNLGNWESRGNWSLLGTGGHGPSVDWDAAKGRPRIWTGKLTTRIDDALGVVRLDAGQAESFVAACANGRTGDSGHPMRGFSHGYRSVEIAGISGDDVSVICLGPLPAAGTAVEFSPGPAGFQEFDRDVLPTTIRKGNFLHVKGGIPASEALGNDTIPNSYFRSSKPAFFGDLAWPPYDPNNPKDYDGTEIPAGYRFLRGTTPAPQPTPSPDPAPTPAPEPTPAPTPPEIIAALPDSVFVHFKQDVTLAISARGDDLTYRWYKDGVEMPGKYLPYITLRRVSPSAAGGYRVTVTGNAGLNASSTAKLMVIK